VGVERSEVIRTLKDMGQFRGEMIQRRKDGMPIYVEATAIVLRNNDGRVTGYVTVNRDITGRKKAEAEQRRLSEELVEKNSELEQIVYVTSHDLRSPLVNIQGFSKELCCSLQELVSILRDVDMLPEQRERVSVILDSDLAEALMYIQASALKMDSLLSGLLRLSRIGRAVVNLEPLDMNLLLSDIVKSFEYRIKETGCNVKIGDLPACTGDAGQINQLFSNLLDNALKYLDPSRPGMISITGRKEKHEVVYCVEDNGVGISKGHQRKIFELFYRVDPQVCSGEGLGLNIARKILSRHGGTMWVESEPGVGSKFFASLPSVK
jgi:signal transduction histidine kinase